MPRPSAAHSGTLARSGEVRTSDERYPLSPMQQGMLFHTLSAPDRGVDIEQMVCRLREWLDSAAFRHAWERLAERHAALRTRFNTDDGGEPVQIVEPAGSVPFEEADWRELSGDEQTARLEAFLAADRRRGFEMDRAPLMRLALFRRADADYQLVWTFHHALLDGRSLPLLLNELFSLYEASVEGRNLFLPPPAPYRDYIEWLGRQEFSRSEPFWRTQLKGFSAPTSVSLLPPEPVPTEDPVHGARETRLSPQLTEALRAAARDHGVTLNTLVQGAWALLLSRYTGEEDVLFGATRACRRSGLADGPERVGLFINTLPVRVRVPPEARLGPWLQQLRARQLAVREHEHTPLAQVQAWSDLPPGTPLFESIVMFDHASLDAATKAWGGPWLNRDFRLVENTGYPLTLTAYGDTPLQLAIAFDGKRYDEQAVARMLSHLETLLAGMVACPELCLGELPLLHEEARRQLLFEWNEPQAEYDSPASLAAMFEAQAERTPESVAVVCEGRSLTYRELNARADRIAHHLQASGVRPEARVAVLLERTLELVVGVLAVVKAGGVYVPLDPACPPERLAFMLADSESSLCVTQRAFLDRLPTDGPPALCLDTALLETEAASPHPVPGLTPDHAAYVIYTSGSTGAPKGVVVSHGNVLRLFAAAQSWCRFSDQDVWTLFHNVAFDFSVWELWGALLHGGRLVIVPFEVSRSPEAFRELLVRERVTVLNQTPTAFFPLIEAEANEARLTDLRLVIFGGEVLDLPGLQPWFERHGDQSPQLVNMYGITETTVHVTYRPLTAGDAGAGLGSRIGRGLPDLWVYVLDSRGQPVPIGVPGELYVGGAGLARGYLNRPDLTAERFVPDPFSGRAGGRLYRTGDRVRWRSGGDLEYLGRVDDQVKIRGFRIELGEIEAALEAHPGVRQSVVLAREDPGAAVGRSEKRLVAYFVPVGEPPLIPELRRHLQARLPDYMVPAAFLGLPSLPLTVNGKVDRRALPAPDETRPALAESFVAPETPLEQTLAAIWADVLRLDRVGVHDNFFDLGGDSILSLQIVGRARQAGLKLTPKQLFQCQTIARLAGEVQTNEETMVDEEAASGPVPLTPIQRWFFEQRLADPHHYNQAMLLDVTPGLDASRWNQAVRRVFGQHDVFRLRYTGENGVWSQSHVDGAEPVSFAAIDLTELTAADERAVLDTVIAEAQGSLDLPVGPLARAIYLDRGPEQRGWLLLVVHHLVIDGVSWRILLEELQAALLRPSPPALLPKKTGKAEANEVTLPGTPLPAVFGRGAGGEGLSSLPPKTTPFQHWSRRLSGYVRSSSLRDEAAYWLSEAGVGSPPLPRDFAGGENTVASEACIRVQLSAAETQALLRQAPAVHGAQINDLLLAALSEATASWTGAPALRVDLEGHGREALFDGVDLSRTVGWFTSLFPVLLDLAAARVPGGALPAVKERLRRLPCRGIGYGVLRYLCEDAAITDRLRALPASEVSFNYLGQFDGMFTDPTVMGSAWEWCRGARSPRQRRSHLLAIDGQTVGGRMEWVWTYSSAVHRRETIERVADRFIAALRGLLPGELSLSSTVETVSDLADVPLSPEGLDSLLAELDFDSVPAD